MDADELQEELEKFLSLTEDCNAENVTVFVSEGFDKEELLSLYTIPPHCASITSEDLTARATRENAL